MKHSLPSPRRASTRRKALVTGGLVALTAAGVGGAAFAAFTATTTASQTDTAGDMAFVDISNPGAGQRLSVGATDIAPGDSIQRAVTLQNSGSVEMVSANLTTEASASSLLDTDTTDGLQMVVDQCATPWVEAGPAYTYTCAGTVTTVVATTPVIGSGIALPGLDLTEGTPNYLRVTLAFPGTADNDFQNESSTIDFTFNGVQRAGIAQ